VPENNANQLMMGSHDPLFVILSLVIASIASYAALDLAGRVRSAEGSTRWGWLAGGATVMGLGIWSMHFVAMLAFHLPIPIAYEVPRVLLSVAVAIGASLLALIVVSRARLRPTALIAGGALMGGAIAGMHYIGMSSMAVAATLSYRPPIVLLSVVIAILASLAALGLAFSFRSDVSARGRLLKSVSAVVMGIAIAGMHYTAMAGARFAPHPMTAPRDGFLLATAGLAAAVAACTLAILVLALIGAVIDRNIQSKVEFTKRLEQMNAELQHSLYDAQRARRELAREHAAYLALQSVAQQDAAKARWLEGVAEATTALAHEVNNPLTALMMNLELLGERLPDEASESIATIKASARRIASVVKRLSDAGSARSVAYVGVTRMLDLSPEDTDQERLPEPLRMSGIPTTPGTKSQDSDS
jgi:NO-binding membrane sensor protein with MHYT domain